MLRFIRPAHGLLSLVLGALSLPLVAALTIDRLGWKLSAQATAVACSLAVALLIVAVRYLWRRSNYAVRWSWPLLAELAVLCGVLFGSFSYLLWLSGSPFLPVGTSVDGGWHYGLVDHLLQTQQLGVSDRRLGDVDSYTPGYHLLAMLLAQWLGREPIYIIYPTVAAFLALGIATTAQIAMDAAPAGAWRPVAGLAALVALMLVPPAYTIEIVTNQNFYPTAAGLVWLLVIAWAAGLLHRSGDWVAWLPLSFAIIGLIVCYPFWLPLALGLLLALSVSRCWGNWRRLAQELALLVGIHGAGLALVHDLLADQLRQAERRGPELSIPQVALIIALAVGGLALSRRLHRWPLLPVSVLSVLTLLQYYLVGGMASYMGQKTLYSLPYVTVAAGAATLGLMLRLARRTRTRWLQLGLLLAALAAVGVAQARAGELDWLAQRPFHPLNPQQVRVALWVRDQIAPDPDRVAYVVEHNITAYWIKVGLLRSPRGWSARSVLDYPLPRYSHWATDPAQLDYAFVDNLERQLIGPPAHLLYREGSARFLARATSQAESAQLYIQAHTTPELFGARRTIRTTAYLSTLPGTEYRLSFLLTPRAEGDTPGEVLWQQPLDTQAKGPAHYGLVRLDPAKPAAMIWGDGEPLPVEPPALPPGTPLSAWMQLSYNDQPVAVRRIYDLEWGDPASLQLRDLNPNSIFLWKPQPLEIPRPAVVSEAELGERVRLERWELEDPQLTQGLTTTLSVEWLSLQPIEPPARIFVHLVGTDGKSYPVYDGEPHGGFYPLWLWRPGETVRDRLTLALPQDIAHGTYELVVGIYNPLTGQRLPVTAGSATAHGSAAELQQIEVRARAQ